MISSSSGRPRIQSFATAMPGWRALYEERAGATGTTEVPVLGWATCVVEERVVDGTLVGDVDGPSCSTVIRGVIPADDARFGTYFADDLTGFVRFLGPGENRWDERYPWRRDPPRAGGSK